MTIWLHVEGLLPVSLCLVTLLSLEQCLHFERSHHHDEMVNKTSSFKTKLTGNNAKASRIKCNTAWCFTLPYSRQQTSHYKLLPGDGSLPLKLCVLLFGVVYFVYFCGTLYSRGCHWCIMFAILWIICLVDDNYTLFFYGQISRRLVSVWVGMFTPPWGSHHLNNKLVRKTCH